MSQIRQGGYDVEHKAYQSHVMIEGRSEIWSPKSGDATIAEKMPLSEILVQVQGSRAPPFQLSFTRWTSSLDSDAFAARISSTELSRVVAA